MDIEKLIAGLSKEAYGSDVEELLLEAATALSTLQAENEKLKDQLYDGEGVNLVNYWMQQAKIEENGHRNCQAENEQLRAKLEQMKAERDAAVDCIYQIEDDLNRGSDNDWAREHIAEWESHKED